MRHDFGRQVDVDLLNPHHALGGGRQRAAQDRILAFAGIAQFHVELHCVAVDAQVFQLAGRDKVFAGVRVNNGLERCQQGGFGGGHKWFRVGCSAGEAV